jgi:hypothetical protein
MRHRDRLHAKKREKEEAYLARVEIEVRRVELVRLGEVCHAHAEVAELVNRGWPFLEALELVRSAVLDHRLCVDQRMSATTTFLGPHSLCFR